MDEAPRYDYIGVFDDVIPPDPDPVRLLRKTVVAGQDVEEIWTAPGVWKRSRFLVELGFGHGDGEPRPMSRDDMEHWQKKFVEAWRIRDQGRRPS